MNNKKKKKQKGIIKINKYRVKPEKDKKTKKNEGKYNIKKCDGKN